jgi:hypothetical protein
MTLALPGIAFLSLFFSIVFSDTAYCRSAKKTLIHPLELPVTHARLKHSFGRLGGKINEGISLSAPMGSEVSAAAKGRVIDAHQIGKSAEVLVIDHGLFYTVYDGILEVSVKQGDWVDTLQKIGRLSPRGLNFEVRLQDLEPVDPFDYLKLKIKGQADKLTEAGVATVLASAGFPTPMIPIFSCIAFYESGWRPRAQNKNQNDSHDTGLLQINDIHLPFCGLKERTALFELDLNAQCAKKVWDKFGLNAWVAFRKKRAICLGEKKAQAD